MNATIGSVETVSTLERRVNLTLPVTAISAEVDVRLKKLARQVKMPGFRPGKVPLKMVAQSYGYQVESEVVSDALNKAFVDAVQQHSLRVAGQPKIEQKKLEGEAAPQALSFDALFEVYPEVKLGDVTTLTVEKIVLSVTDAEVDKTIDVLRKQRANYTEVQRAAQNDDRVTIDFAGKIDGVPFEGGTANDFPFTLGQQQMLPEFESGVLGLTVGGTKAVEVKFPEDYHGKEVAGKTAIFEITLKKLEAPVLPELNADFAKQMGVADGDIQKLRADIKENLEREVKNRLTQRNKQTALDGLLTIAELVVPKTLIEQEAQRMVETARNELQARGAKADMPIPAELFNEQAEKRVRLGLIVAEIVKTQKLEAKPDQVKAVIEEQAKSYERPDEIIRWYYQDMSRLDGIRAVVMEDNLLDWILSQAKVTEKAVTFDEIMAR